MRSWKFRTTLGAAGSYTATQLVAKGLGLAFLLLAASIGDEHSLGRALLAIVSAAVLTLVFDFGRAAQTLRSFAHKPGSVDANRYQTRQRAYSALTIVMIVLSYTVPPTAQLALITVATGSVMGANMLRESALLALGRGGAAGGANVGFNLTACIAIIAMAAMGDLSGSSIVSAYLLGAIAASAIGAAVMRSEIRKLSVPQISSPPLLSEDPRRERYAATGIAHLLLLLSSRADQIILGAIATPSALGVYGLAARITDTATALPNIIANALQPAFVSALRGADREAALRSYLLRLVAGAALLAVVVSAVAPLLLSHLLGSSFQDADTVLQVLGIGVAAYGVQLYGLLVVRCTSVLAPARVARYYGTHACLSALAVGAGYYAAGPIGVAVGKVTADAIGYLVVAIWVNRSINVESPPWLMPLALCLPAAAVVTAHRGTAFATALSFAACMGAVALRRLTRHLRALAKRLGTTDAPHSAPQRSETDS